jgi:2-polyprenyl-6-methoxyphenol hydroxylase-like FAD-dependent oxidoreductase
MLAVIIGAGIGGLAAAVALRKVGVEVLVVERAPAIHEIGAGLSIWLNAIRALRELDVDSALAPCSSVVERILSRTSSGRPIGIIDLRNLSGDVGIACICVHRADLQHVLLEALPPGAVRTGSNCVAFDGTDAILASGERISGDALIGADGISSVVRAALHGAHPPRYAGYTCWRGICNNEDVLPERAALLVTAAGSQFGAWPCRPGQIYWFLTKNAPAATCQTRTDALALCRNWAPPVPHIIEATGDDAVLQNDIIDRPPLRGWGRGPVTLLGDAAHAATPNLGQGACQALEDAVTLAHCLRSVAPPGAALRAYEKLRIPRTTAVVKNSWKTGRRLQTEQPALISLRNWLSATSLGAHLQRQMFRELLAFRVPKL